MRPEDEVRVARAEHAAIAITGETRDSVDHIQIVVRILVGLSCAACVLSIWVLWDYALAAEKGWALAMLVAGVVGLTGTSIELARQRGLEKRPGAG